MSLPTQPSFPSISHSKFHAKKTMYSPRASSSNAYARQNPSYGDRSSINLVDKNGKLSQEHEVTHRNPYSEVQFTPVHHLLAMKSDDSGAISPPLWRNNSPSPPRSPSRPLLGHRGYQSLSPDSRAQAIARGRSELMEMVRHMPESSYELSLKDIVEHQHRAENQSPKIGGESLSNSRGEAAGMKKDESRKFDRNLSFENKGFFLNMAFPFSFNFKSKKKKKIVGNNSGRVSPKPEGLKGGGERDWWKKKFTGSSDSDSSRTSNNSGSSGATGGSSSSGATGGSRSGGDGGSHSDVRGRRKNRFTAGCWHFFHFQRSKSA